ncbi:g1392 [Coccomyxa elongata]
MTERSVGCATEKARKLLHKRVQVHIVDGRVITGNLSCVDKQQNLVLQHATQSYSTINDPTGERQLGTVIVPKQQRKSCHVEVTPHDRGSIG